MGMLPLLTTGCLVMDPTVGKFLSAIGKLSADWNDPPIGDLNREELLALSAGFSQLAAQVPQLGISAEQIAAAPQLTAQQADDIVAFLDQQNVRTVSELQELIVRIDRGQIQVDIPPSLLDLAAALGFETKAENLN